MKHVVASQRTYEATLGPIEPGKTYFVDDAVAERWIGNGIAREGRAPEPEPAPPAPPKPDGDEDEEDEDEEEDEEEKARLRAEARRLYEAGSSQRQVAEQMGISRTSVRRLLGA